MVAFHVENGHGHRHVVFKSFVFYQVVFLLQVIQCWKVAQQNEIKNTNHLVHINNRNYVNLLEWWSGAIFPFKKTFLINRQSCVDFFSLFIVRIVLFNSILSVFLPHTHEIYWIQPRDKNVIKIDKFCWVLIIINESNWNFIIIVALFYLCVIFFWYGAIPFSPNS